MTPRTIKKKRERFFASLRMTVRRHASLERHAAIKRHDAIKRPVIIECHVVIERHAVILNEVKDPFFVFPFSLESRSFRPSR